MDEVKLPNGLIHSKQEDENITPPSLDKLPSNFIGGVLIATFANPKEACAACRALGGKRDKTRFFKIFFDKIFPTKDYESKKIRAQLRQFNPQKIGEHGSYQEIEVTITLPQKFTLDMLPLAFDAETVELVQKVNALCGPPVVKKRGNKDVLTFLYAGKPILFPIGFYFDEKVISFSNVIKTRIKHNYSCF